MHKFIWAVLIIIFLMPVNAFAQDEGFNQVENVASSISGITGIAISPFLVIGAIGIYKNIKASKDVRSEFPWYFKSGFLTFCIILSVLTAIIGLPALANMPPQIISIVDLINKKAGLLLSLPLVYDVISPIAAPLNEMLETAFLSDNGFAYASLLPMIPVVLRLIFTMVTLFFAFVAVWLLNYIFDVLVFLSPFGWVDTILKIFRGVILLLILILTAIYPPLSFIITIPIIFISIRLFGWSVRRFVMGLVFMKDFFNMKKETVIDEKGILSFSESGLKMPSKRLGRLKEADGKWSFSYKRFFLFDKTKVIHKKESILIKGFISSEIRQEEKNAVCSLPPRYQKNSGQVQAFLNIDDLQDSSLKRGITAMIEWIKNLFRSEKEPATLT